MVKWHGNIYHPSTHSLATSAECLFIIFIKLQIWMVMGKEGQEDFKNRFPERAAKAMEGAVSYTKGWFYEKASRKYN